MATKTNSILQEEVTKRGIVTKSVCDALLKEAEKSNKNLIEVLVKHNISSEKELLGILAERLKVHFVDLKMLNIDNSVINKVPIKLASYYKVIPTKIEGRNLDELLSQIDNEELQELIRAINIRQEEAFINRSVFRAAMITCTALKQLRHSLSTATQNRTIDPDEFCNRIKAELGGFCDRARVELDKPSQER